MTPPARRICDVQRTALALRQRGVVLAVSSKNTDEVARLPFAKHPEMLLREDHIAVFQANWQDKASNIDAIAEELELGLDSLVFLDDNPVERALVRRLLPEVAVPELPTIRRCTAGRCWPPATSKPSLFRPKTSSAPISIRTTRGAWRCKSSRATWTATWLL